jgi:cytochrome o ubiquinol oxidase operon protein cyoD
MENHATTHASTHGGESHGSAKSYLIGFALSVLLTAAAFWAATASGLPTKDIIITIATLAVVQILVHLVYFLHMNTSSAQRWNVTAFAFTVVILAIVVGGNLWVMHNSNVLMMPHMETNTGY